MSRLRKAEVSRKTAETEVSISLSLDGGDISVDTGIPMFDHMLRTLAYYAGWGINVRARGDLQHHTVEDVGISLGMALRDALGDRSGVARFGSAIVPMDGSLAICAVDLARRAYYTSNVPEYDVEGLSGGLLSHFLRSFAFNAELTLSVYAVYCDGPHHCFESVFKAAGMAIRQASALTGGGYVSTKGSL